MDAFTRGKLAEIGVQNMLQEINTKKTYELDFTIRSTSEVKEDPDIIRVCDRGIWREPNLFVEIKNFSHGDRWTGLTEEQLETMKKGAGGRDIYIFYISILSDISEQNPKTADFVGMYLKEISGLALFDKFAPLNAVGKLEFVITADDLGKFGREFPAGDLLYETDLFPEASIWKADGTLRKGVEGAGSSESYSGKIQVPTYDGNIADKGIGEFAFEGSFALYLKKNPKSQRNYIFCSQDTKLKNEIFGTFQLKRSRCYQFNLPTVGRDPVLKRNNLWIASRRIAELVDEGQLPDPDASMRRGAEEI